jgi:hypothetical protein
MATEINVWTGAEWESIRGPAGATGPEGPTVVSADAVNVAKLGTDGKILVAQADLDTRYVNVNGDTMTGPLAVTPSAALAAPAGHVQISGQGFQPAVAIQGRGDTNGTGTPQVRFFRTRGTAAAPASVQANDNLGTLAFYGWLPNGTAANPVSILAQCDATPAAGDTTAKGRITLVTTTLVCTATNFTLNASGELAGTITNGGAAASFRSNGNGDGKTGLGVTGAASGVSATSGAVTGVRGEVTGTVSTGVAVNAEATATATQNFGLRTIVNGGTRNCGVYVDVPKAANSWAIQCQGDADSYFKSNVGIGWSTPSALLEVGGTARIRSTLEVVGNITSTGTAHSFAANSIPSPAVVGGAAFTPASSAAAGSPGSIRWDESYLYVRTATAWKRIALTSF